MRWPLAVLFMGALALGGCCKNKSSSDSTDPFAAPVAKPMTAPPTPVWKERELSFAEIDARASFMVKDLAYAISFNRFPVGTQITMNGKTETVNDRGSLSSTVDISEKVAAMTPKNAIDFRYKLDPQFKISFKFPGDVTLDVDAPAMAIWFDLKNTLEKVSNHPVLFGKETATESSKHSMLFLGVTTELFGAATTMGEVDWIAVREKLPPREGKVCHGYKDVGDKTGKGKSLQMQMQDEEVAIYARRTGKLVEKKKFSASTRCPMFASGGTPTSYPSGTEVKAWLRKKVR